MRDPNGVRPLVLGKIGDAHILTSETVALDIIGAEFIRDIEPGEMVVIDESGVNSHFPFPKAKERFCIFEYIYFARPDSEVEGHSVYSARKAIGAELAKEAPVEADVIIPVPDSGVPAAIGYAAAAKVPFELGIIRNHYVGRTFIQPTDAVRHLGVKLKHNANPGEIAGKRVVLVDDLIHQTTSTKIVEMVCLPVQPGAYADRQPADHAFPLLRRRHADAGEAAGRPFADESRADRRQSRLHFHRRAVSCDGTERTRYREPAVRDAVSRATIRLS